MAISVIAAFGTKGVKSKDHEFQVSLGYIATSSFSRKEKTTGQSNIQTACIINK